MSRHLAFEQQVTAEVEVSLDELADELDTQDITYIIQKKGLRAPAGIGDGDPTADRYIEAAYRDVLAMSDCPQSVRDLLWHVHGRAIG